MTTISAKNARASNNGKIAEDYISNEYHIEITTKAIIDGHYNGFPVEVKSCQLWITDNHNSLSRRRGRFWLREDQHAHLLKNSGFYIFVLLEDEQPLYSKFIPAWSISPLFTTNRTNFQIVCTKIFPELKGGEY